MLAIDFDRRKARRQRATRHDMLGSNCMRGAVEIDKIAGPDIDGTRAEPRHTGVETIKIDQPLQCRLERARVVDARRRKRSTRL